MTPRATPDVRRARDAAELDAAFALRHQVFVDEQGFSVEEDRDGLDDDAIQLVAVTPSGKVVGTCRILASPGGSGRFGRLCVRRDHRRRGIAAALLVAAEREARAAGCVRIGMHAQTDAMALYVAAGYVTYGEPFDEGGVEHVGMEKALA